MLELVELVDVDVVDVVDVVNPTGLVDFSVRTAVTGMSTSVVYGDVKW